MGGCLAPRKSAPPREFLNNTIVKDLAPALVQVYNKGSRRVVSDLGDILMKGKCVSEFHLQKSHLREQRTAALCLLGNEVQLVSTWFPSLTTGTAWNCTSLYCPGRISSWTVGQSVDVADLSRVSENGDPTCHVGTRLRCFRSCLCSSRYSIPSPGGWKLLRTP